MAIIYSYPTVVPTKTDLILGTDVSTTNKSTKNFTVQSIIDLVTVATGDLQTVLDLGNIAIGKDIVLGTIAVPSNTMHAGVFTTGPGLIIISNNTATGLANVTSTLFTGTIATPAQPNITSLGTLTSLKIGNATPAVTSIETVFTNPGTDLALATTKAIVDYIATKPNPETLAETLANGNLTGGTDIAVSAGDDITFTDTSKILMGASNDLEIFHDSSHSYIKDTGTGDLTICGSTIVLNNAADNANMITATEGSLVRLFHDGQPKLVTAAIGVSVTGGVAATGSGTFVNLLNSGTYQDSSGDVGTSGQILSSTGTGTNWVTEVPLYNWQFESTAIPSGTDITITDGNNITTTWNAGTYALTIAASGDGVTGSGAVGQVAFWTGTQTESGNGQFLYDATNARARIISNAVAGSGVMGAVTFTTELTTFPTPSSSPQWVGSTMTNMTSITSTSFVGALTGNATTATSLAATGTMSVSGDVSTVGTPPTYTSGGDKVISTTIADTVVTGKVLTNLATPTSAAISAGDTILAAMAKLQGQITGLAGSLAFEGTWDASTGNPPSATPLNGQFWIVSVAGSTNLSGITDWLVGDWAIYVNNGAGTDAWQKLDQSNEVLGSGTAQKMAMWSGTVGDASQTLATGLIEQDSANTLITIGNSGSLLVEGNTTLGNAATDTVTATGPVTFNETLNIKKGILIDGTQGTDGYVLTSGAGSGAAMSWAQPTVGTVTSVSATTTGDALDVVVSTATTTPAIALTWAGGAAGANDYVNGLGNLTTFPTLDNYVSWTLAGDSGATQTISSLNTATIAGGAGVNTQTGTKSVAINLAYTNIANTNFVDQATAATPSSGDQLLFSTAGDVKRASIASIVDLGNETLAQVLSNGNTTGGTDISVSAADDIKFTDTSKAIFGAANDLQIYHDGLHSEIKHDGQGTLQILSDSLRIQNVLNQSYIEAGSGSSVELYYNNLNRFKTTTTGVEVVNTDSSVPPTILLNQDSNNFIITQSVSGGGQITNSSGSLALRNDASINLQNNAGTYTKASFDSSISFSPDNLAATATVPGVTIYQSTDATADGTRTRVYGDLQVDGNIINEGSGGGIFYGDQAVPAGGASTLAFTLTRAATGTLIFDVMITSEQSNASSQCMKYTVAHSYNTDPVYNKIIDTGPDGTTGFTATFANSNTGATGTSVTCSLATVGGVSQNIGYTVQVGHDSTNALTFTPAS